MTCSLVTLSDSYLCSSQASFPNRTTDVAAQRFYPSSAVADNMVCTLHL